MHLLSLLFFAVGINCYVFAEQLLHSETADFKGRIKNVEHVGSNDYVRNWGFWKNKNGKSTKSEGIQDFSNGNDAAFANAGENGNVRNWGFWKNRNGKPTKSEGTQDFSNGNDAAFANAEENGNVRNWGFWKNRNGKPTNA